jgi:hypothetical protein
MTPQVKAFDFYPLSRHVRLITIDHRLDTISQTFSRKERIAKTQIVRDDLCSQKVRFEFDVPLHELFSSLDFFFNPKIIMIIAFYIVLLRFGAILGLIWKIAI